MSANTLVYLVGVDVKMACSEILDKIVWDSLRKKEKNFHQVSAQHQTLNDKLYACNMWNVTITVSFCRPI